MESLNRIIWTKFRVKRSDTVPYVGWSNLNTREGLAQLLGELGYRRGAEIGVQAGKYSEVLCRNIPNHELYCIDPWGAYPRQSAERSEQYYQIARHRLGQYNTKIIRKPGMEALSEFQDGELDFVYIDALHDFDSVMMDLIHWPKKVKRGGIIAGHDYYNFCEGGVIKAVDTYTIAHGINLWYITKEPLPSFYWVN